MRFTRFSPKTFVQSVRRVPARFRRSLSEYRFYAYFAVLGPGIIAASSGNEVSGIATYSSAGATYGYTLLWTFIPMTVFFIVAQEMCVRMGVVTGQGLADLIREQFGVRWTALVMLALLIANSGIIIAEFVGIAQASELFGVSSYATVPITAVIIWWLVVRGTPKRVEQVFLLMSLVFLAYIFAAFLSKPDWPMVAREFVTPSFKFRLCIFIYGDGAHRYNDHAVHADICSELGG
jgi:NRAMP (natural resistance-associated macrophage protein)-like metal ion transporter